MPDKPTREDLHRTEAAAAKARDRLWRLESLVDRFKNRYESAERDREAIRRALTPGFFLSDPQVEEISEVISQFARDDQKVVVKRSECSPDRISFCLGTTFGDITTSYEVDHEYQWRERLHIVPGKDGTPEGATRFASVLRSAVDLLAAIRGIQYGPTRATPLLRDLWLRAYRGLRVVPQDLGPLRALGDWFEGNGHPGCAHGCRHSDPTSVPPLLSYLESIGMSLEQAEAIRRDWTYMASSNRNR